MTLPALILRSGPKDRVSKDEGGPILRDASLRDAPQDETVRGQSKPHACFWFLWTASRFVTQFRAERNQFCFFGASWSRCARMPTRTM